MYHSQSYLANWLHHSLRNILLINILLLVVLSDCVQCLDAEKDNSTSVSSAQVDDNNGDFGSDEEFTLDSVEQLWDILTYQIHLFHNCTHRTPIIRTYIVSTCPVLPFRPCADLRGYAFHNQTKRCWKIGTKGPCNGPLMTFSSDPEHEGYGDCDCVRMKNCIGRPRSYHEASDRCHFLYTRVIYIDTDPKFISYYFQLFTNQGIRQIKTKRLTCIILGAMSSWPMVGVW